MELAQRALPKRGPLVLLGESFSGPIAVMLAAKLQRRVIGLILCCSFVKNPRPRLAFLKPLMRFNAPDWLPISFAAASLFGRNASPELIKLLTTSLNSVNPAVLRARLIEIVDVDATPALGMVTAPVLYLQAANDKLVPPRAALIAAKIVPAMRIAVFAGPHGLLQTSPLPTAKIVVEFVDGLVLRNRSKVISP